MKTFKVDNGADATGTSFRGQTRRSSHQALTLVFGEPRPGDERKVSGVWNFRADDGDVVTLYDWKSTDLYDADRPSLKEFRSGVNEYNVAGYSEESCEDFLEWFHGSRG